MLFDEAQKIKKEKFHDIENRINDSINECIEMYEFLSGYNDLIVYEELYSLTDDDKEKFIDIRDRSHEIEHLLIHYKEDIIFLIESDIEWLLTNSMDDESNLNDFKNSTVYYNYFKLEIIVSLIFDKLKNLNIPRKKELNDALHVHNGGGCC
ncbi:hypothetical protein [uncultured Methanosphaera sp.]|uniref:hypothetical protein n=1 Tax=uncultured Methanosphaera sp. TaxID=262501 RepID=UPI000DC3901B|nr:hypothetical protein [uncultured Methanosphaera sp.]RAP44252.1 MAG: hypothetical protein BZ134_03995 [Methanosphaera sp. SHI1033]